MKNWIRNIPESLINTKLIFKSTDILTEMKTLYLKTSPK